MNLPTSHVVAPADPNVEGTNSGMNAGSCFPGIGVSTGNYDGKTEDWSDLQRAPLQTQAIGATATDVLAVDYEAVDFNDKVGYVLTVAETPNGGLIGATGYANHTGETVPAGVWIWGTKPTA